MVKTVIEEGGSELRFDVERYIPRSREWWALIAEYADSTGDYRWEVLRTSTAPATVERDRQRLTADYAATVRLVDSTPSGRGSRPRTG